MDNIYDNPVFYSQMLMFEPLEKWATGEHFENPSLPLQYFAKGVVLNDDGSVTFT